MDPNVAAARSPLSRLTERLNSTRELSPPSRAPLSQDGARYEEALADHVRIFSADSHAILVWPDHFLSYEPLGATTRFDADSLQALFKQAGRRLILDGSTAVLPFNDSVSTVRATTSLLGPAAFPLHERSPEFPPLIAVVGFDSARPRSLALKSLAGISCPTVMLTRLLPREDLHAFVRFHESGHVFQHLAGRIKPDDLETPYERCKIEAEADVFAALWWIKTRNGDTSVPTYFTHLRTSNFFERAASGDHRLTLQYATMLPLVQALERGEQLWRKGALQEMESDDVQALSRAIVDSALPQERVLITSILSLRHQLEQGWKLLYHPRLLFLKERLQSNEFPDDVIPFVQMYLNSADFLTSPEHLRESHPHLQHLSLSQRAQEVWLEELVQDLNFSTIPPLVIDRYERELAAHALAVWQLTVSSQDPDALKGYLQRTGKEDEFFVPSDLRSALLSSARELVTKGASR